MGKTITVQGRCNVINDAQGRPNPGSLSAPTSPNGKTWKSSPARAPERMEGIGALASGIAHDLEQRSDPPARRIADLLKDKVTDEDGRKKAAAGLGSQC